METQWFDINTYGNPKHTGRYKVKTQNGWIGELNFDYRYNYWHTLGYQSDIKEWSFIIENI